MSIFPKLPDVTTEEEVPDVAGVNEIKPDQIEQTDQPNAVPVKFTETELLDTTVVDSEGYILGKIDSLRIEPKEIFIKLYGIEKESHQVVDGTALVEKLAKIMPLKRSLVDGEPQPENLSKVIREQMGLSSDEPIKEEIVVSYAKSLGLSVPYTLRDTEKRVERGSIPWSYVDRVGSSDFGRCVILREAYEAKRRGVEPQHSVPFQGKKDLEGKMVIDSEAKPIGTAREILIGVTPGILVSKESFKQEEIPDLEKLKKDLIPSRFRDFDDFTKKVKKDLNKKTVGLPEIATWCKRNDKPFPVKKQTRVVTDFEFSVDWRDILKIGDLIILSKTIETLARRQMQPKNLELLIK